MGGGRSKEARKQLQETDMQFPKSLPCHKGHDHYWPTEGPITMEHVGRCQVYCQFCALHPTNPMVVEAKWGWYLRRHIYQVHRKEFPNLIVPEEWSGKKETSKGSVGPKKGQHSKPRAKKSAKKSAAATPVMPTTPVEMYDETALTAYTDTPGSLSISDEKLNQLMEMGMGPFKQAQAATLPAYTTAVGPMQLNHQAVVNLSGDESEPFVPAEEAALTTSDIFAATPACERHLLDQFMSLESGSVGSDIIGDYDFSEYFDFGEDVSASQPAPFCATALNETLAVSTAVDFDSIFDDVAY